METIARIVNQVIVFSSHERITGQFSNASYYKADNSSPLVWTECVRHLAVCLSVHLDLTHSCSTTLITYWLVFHCLLCKLLISLPTLHTLHVWGLIDSFTPCKIYHRGNPDGQSWLPRENSYHEQWRTQDSP